MIAKPLELPDLPTDRRLRAGAEAERRMAFYLHRAFATDDSVMVLNNLRLVDPHQPEHDGRDGVCQIDHLLLHQWGAFVIESKSVSDEVTVRGDGAGGDEWTRRAFGRDEGFRSPVQQARMQGEFLRHYLQRHREELLSKAAVGFRTLTKIVMGTDQRGFASMPIQIIVAISDNGKITRKGSWREPDHPFQTFVSKADLVPDKVRAELDKHRSSAPLLSTPNGEYGMWRMKPDELSAVARLLAESHVSVTPRVNAAPAAPPAHASPPPRPELPNPKPPATAAGPACKGCGGGHLTAAWGKYGYYWKCGACNTNTAMPTVCSACGTEGQRGQGVRIRKEGAKYFRACESCRVEEPIWTEGGSAGPN